MRKRPQAGVRRAASACSAPYDVRMKDEAPPTPPIAPQAGDCCQGGCVPCVFEIYEQELALYRDALERWNARRGDGNLMKEGK